MNNAVAARAKTLRHYLLAWALGVLVVVWLALLAFAWSTTFRETRQFSDGQMTAVAKLWLSAAPYRLEPHAPVDVPDLQHEYLQDVALVAWDDGRLVADTHGMVRGLALAALPAQGFATVRVNVPGVVPEWRAYSAQVTQEGRLRRVIVLMDLKQRYELGKDIAEHVALPALLVLPLVSLLLWWAIRRGLRPLDQLSSEVAALDGFAGQRLDTQHRHREFASTVAAINALVDTLQTRAQREREFASDVAHELRTPLAGIRALADYGLAQTTPGIWREQLGRIAASQARASHLVDQLLGLALADEGRTALQREAVRLDAMVEQAVLRHLARADAQGVDLGARGLESEPVTVQASVALIEGILDNLIDNALRYGGRTITVELAGTVLSVVDDGPGIPPEAQRTLTARWAQGPDGQKLGQGAGLGLSIVSRYAELLGAALRLEAVAPTGLRVSLAFGEAA